MALLAAMAVALGPVVHRRGKELAEDADEDGGAVAAPRGDSESPSTRTQEFKKAVM